MIAKKKIIKWNSKPFLWRWAKTDSSQNDLTNFCLVLLINLSNIIEWEYSVVLHKKKIFVKMMTNLLEKISRFHSKIFFCFLLMTKWWWRDQCGLFCRWQVDRIMSMEKSFISRLIYKNNIVFFLLTSIETNSFTRQSK